MTKRKPKQDPGMNWGEGRQISRRELRGGRAALAGSMISAEVVIQERSTDWAVSVYVRGVGTFKGGASTEVKAKALAVEATDHLEEMLRRKLEPARERQRSLEQSIIAQPEDK